MTRGGGSSCSCSSISDYDQVCDENNREREKKATKK